MRDNGSADPNSDWYQQDTCYDSSGRASTVSLPYAGAGTVTPMRCSATQYAYDALGRVQQISTADGPTTYPYSQRAVNVTDVNGVQRISQANALGQTTGSAGSRRTAVRRAPERHQAADWTSPWGDSSPATATTWQITARPLRKGSDVAPSRMTRLDAPCITTSRSVARPTTPTTTTAQAWWRHEGDRERIRPAPQRPQPPRHSTTRLAGYKASSRVIPLRSGSIRTTSSLLQEAAFATAIPSSA